MENYPHHSPDDEPNDPAIERLDSSDIDQAHRPEQPATAPDAPVASSSLEQMSADLTGVLAGFDARGESIPDYEAQGVATLLAALLGPHSEMARFALSGGADPDSLQAECDHLRSDEWRTGHAWQAATIATWITHFDRYLATPLTRLDQPTSHPIAERGLAHAGPQVQQGIRGHGDAFLAYLQLPDVDPERDDLVENFHGTYFGSFPSMDAVIDRMASTQGHLAALENVAENWGMEEFGSLDRPGLEALAREVWDFVEIDGQLHVFSK
jgi:hypothetical protein